MPSRERRREFDLRAGRFESEIRDAEFAKGSLARNGRLPFCRHCGKAFEEQSKVCPRCERKDGMGYLAPIPERNIEEAQRNAYRRAMARVRR